MVISQLSIKMYHIFCIKILILSNDQPYLDVHSLGILGKYTLAVLHRIYIYPDLYVVKTLKDETKNIMLSPACRHDNRYYIKIPQL